MRHEVFVSTYLEGGGGGGGEEGGTCSHRQRGDERAARETNCLSDINQGGGREEAVRRRNEGEMNWRRVRRRRTARRQ